MKNFTNKIHHINIKENLNIYGRSEFDKLYFISLKYVIIAKWKRLFADIHKVQENTLSLFDKTNVNKFLFKSLKILF